MIAPPFNVITVEVSCCVVFSIELLNGRSRTHLLPETVFDPSMCFFGLSHSQRV